MNLKNELIKYTKEQDYPVIVYEMLKRAKQGSSYMIVDKDELDWDDKYFLEDEGLEISHYETEDRIKIYWGHYLY